MQEELRSLIHHTTCFMTKRVPFTVWPTMQGWHDFNFLQYYCARDNYALLSWKFILKTYNGHIRSLAWAANNYSIFASISCDLIRLLGISIVCKQKWCTQMSSTESICLQNIVDCVHTNMVGGCYTELNLYCMVNNRATCRFQSCWVQV